MSDLITRTFSTTKVTIKKASTGEELKKFESTTLPANAEKAKAKVGRAYAKESGQYDFIVEVEHVEELLGITKEQFREIAVPVVRPASQTKSKEA